MENAATTVKRAINKVADDYPAMQTTTVAKHTNCQNIPTVKTHVEAEEERYQREVW